MNPIHDYFPSKLAKGKQFCNRVVEREALQRNIELGRHTVLVSPRRYGKSSLVHQVAAEVKLPFENIDLFLAHDDKTVIKRLLSGISGLISQMLSHSKKAAMIAQKYFKNFKITFNALGVGLELSYAHFNDPVDQVFEALQSLAHLAEEKKQKILFFIDEFQDIATAESAKAIQGAIRHIAQESTWIVFLFSGSSRHFLLDLFDDRNKPLYMLCDKIMLTRISSIDYYPHLQKAAIVHWSTALEEVVITKILAFTELHPFYVNLLCHELWKNDKVPDMDDISSAWARCYENEERRLIAELEKLTRNQQDILKILALHPIDEPTSQHFLNLIRLPLSSVRMGIKALLEKDLIHRIKKEDPNLPQMKRHQYRVLDPLLAYALRKYG